MSVAFVALPNGWTNIFVNPGLQWSDPKEEYRRACPGVFVDTDNSETSFACYDDTGKLHSVLISDQYVRTDWFGEDQ